LVALVYVAAALEPRLDCASRQQCLDVAVRSDWRAWTCRACDAYVAAPLRATPAGSGQTNLDTA
jgi:hypothetical protein